MPRRCARRARQGRLRVRGLPPLPRRHQHMALRRLAAVLLVAACGGGGGEGDQSGCRGECVSLGVALTTIEVEQVVRQAAQEAQARGAAATILVVDRVGNVLAAFRMTGAPLSTVVSSGRGVTGGLEGASVPSELAALSKALTGAYLSSEGNAFSTRTASQIIQENFNPGEVNAPSGPLFGVQFSSLTCSDVVRVSAPVTPGPRGSPLGLSADPGGFPLYKSGTVVGGVGVIADGVYGLDRDVFDLDDDIDEIVALAGSRGFDAPANRRAERITADGRTLRFADRETLASNPAAAPPFTALAGTLVDMPGFYSPPTTRAGTSYGTPASGYRPDAGGLFVLDDGSGNPGFPPRAGTDGLLSLAEVQRVLAEAAAVARHTRAQIRQPLGSAAQVSVVVVDTNGAILGLVRTPDAPIFGTDVAVQKARTALVFSDPNAATSFPALPGAAAYSTRAIGNLSRPFLPDGINASGPGPLSLPFNRWSPFETGLSLDLVINRLLANLPVPGAGSCTALARAANGIQIFPGGFPIYRGAALVGAIGVSGDGVDQDDLVGLLGLANAGAALGTGLGHAPPALRVDQISVQGGQLRYAGCPVAPFLDSNATDACSGL